MDLQKIRDDIDNIDHKILGLLNDRMALALRTAKLKTAVRDRPREARVLEEAERYSRDHKLLVRSGFVRRLFDAIIRESRRIQKSNRTAAIPTSPPRKGSRGEAGRSGSWDSSKGRTGA